MKKKIVLLVGMALVLAIFCRDENQERSGLSQGEAGAAGSKAQTPFAGKIVFQSDMDGNNEIYLLTSQELRRLTDNSWDDSYPRWSPDGKRIALTSNRDGNYDIFVMDENGENLIRVTTSAEDEMDPAWLPDGKSLVYTGVEKKPLGRRSSLWMIDLVSKQTRRIIPDFSGNNILGDVSPRADRVAFTGKKMMGWDVFLFEMESRAVTALTDGGKSCRPRFSPDGESIVFVCHKGDKKGDIWTMKWDGSGQERIMERGTTHDYFPSWSPDETQVVFCSNLKSQYANIGDWALYVVSVSDKTVLPLFDSPGKDVFPDWAR